ncbi:hypothetical protein [Lyngbya confervoides]|uniref:Conjugal transfer protein TrbI n=1 Tax=Lyngbya confervoides BDU141951 TaxID=1574623 RepID=A0ABD4T559_9CYAN|nr:hypothetical protein [Lyngbya confervoides]MCM1983610.1 hypothetical protein [Lyngbya confervoides BDU141951]
MKRRTTQWKATLALLLTLGLGTGPMIPLLTAGPATAQIFRRGGSSNDTRTFRVVRGTRIPAEYRDGETNKILVSPRETLDLTLETKAPVRSTQGTVIIPAGSRIEGQLEPYQDGVRFVADRLILEDGTSEDLDATSRVISRRENLEGRSRDDSIWQGALVGGAAATVISAIVTDVGIAKTLAGAGAGALAGWLIGRDRNQSKEVVLVYPDTDLDLTVNETFLLRRRYASQFN